MLQESDFYRRGLQYEFSPKQISFIGSSLLAVLRAWILRFEKTKVALVSFVYNALYWFTIAIIDAILITITIIIDIVIVIVIAMVLVIVKVIVIV